MNLKKIIRHISSIRNDIFGHHFYLLLFIYYHSAKSLENDGCPVLASNLYHSILPS